jgi:D-3-phosphoglycerate dehydrogenase
MGHQGGYRVGVTPPAFCRSEILRTKLSRVFPDSTFNDRSCYLSESELIEFLKDADAAVIGRDPISEKVLQSLPNLKIIAKYGVGLDSIDQEAMGRHGVHLGWTPGVNRLSVAEMTVGFMIGLCHNLFRGGYGLKSGEWRKHGGVQLAGKTVGIIGCGHVGMEVVRLLVPFGCEILACDILDKSEFCREYEGSQVELGELITRSDIVSLHVPLTELTRNMMDGEVFKQMKTTAFLINTSRGGVVDQEALKTALRDETLAGAALDVFVEEPPADKELLALPNLMVTPHIGGNTREAVEAMGGSAIDHLVKFFQDEPETGGLET